MVTASTVTATHRHPGPARVPGRGAAVVLLAALVALLVLPSRAHAVESDPTDDWGLQATLGVDGHDVRGAWRPVTVTVAPSVPVRGRLLVGADRNGSRVVQSREVEVTAGARKQWVLLAPPATAVQVQLTDDDGRVDTVVPARERVDGILVGVLGGMAPTDLPRVTLPATDQRTVPVTVGEDLLALGGRALASLDTLVVRQAALAALDPSARDAVAQRVTDGATLVVLAATDPDLGLPWRATTEHTTSGLVAAPGAWATTTAALAGIDDRTVGPNVAAVAAGRGRLVVTTDDLGSPTLRDVAPWEHLLQPAAGTAAGADRATEELPDRVERAFGSVVGDPPSVAWLAGFLLVYVVVAGPVLGVVMARRRRPELAWVVLPVVTALFAAAAFLGASGSRPRAGAAGQVAAWLDGVGTDLAVGGVRAPTAGTHELVLPGTGWDVASAAWSGTARVEPGTDTTVTLTLPGQSFGAVVAQRPAAGPPPLDLELALFAGEARVEVTNVGDQPVANLELRVAHERRTLADTLPPGETLVRTVPLPDRLAPRVDVFDDGFRGPFGREPDARALADLLRWDLLDGAPGTAWVVGTVEGMATPGVGTIDGGAPSQRGTVVAVGVTPPVTDDATTPYEVQRDLVATTDQVWPQAPLTLTGTGPATLRFRLPAEGELDTLALDLDRGCCGMAVPEPRPVERCGRLEVRDEDTGDLLRVEDRACSDGGLFCPPDASSCAWGPDAGPVVEGRACFPDRVVPDADLDAGRRRPAPGRDAPAGRRVGHGGLGPPRATVGRHQRGRRGRTDPRAGALGRPARGRVGPRHRHARALRPRPAVRVGDAAGRIRMSALARRPRRPHRARRPPRSRRP